MKKIDHKTFARALIAVAAILLLASCATMSEPQRQSLNELQQLADQGDARAQTSLGVLYAIDRGRGHDSGKLQFPIKNLGTMLPDLTAESLKKMTDHILNDKEYRLGEMYRDGMKLIFHVTGEQIENLFLTKKVLPNDDAKAVEWFRKAADQGFADAEYDLGEMYRVGSGVAKDEAKAVEWFQKAADQGLTDAQQRLGEMYRDGRGVAKDEAKAEEWFQKTAAQEDAGARK